MPEHRAILSIDRGEGEPRRLDSWWLFEIGRSIHRQPPASDSRQGAGSVLDACYARLCFGNPIRSDALATALGAALTV